ncbi:universal stress protein [Cronbergia sp. UHCC 0137]|uniref:universal stress protein n=1 Tax=Cronbergia sp. UHCC 0137 TaxID=3110239 RepID=UPI002B20EE09|nr:universal stress protein [Cronbergia sp. UHCC 0137]MEA5619074.1 universal stress protein [Cronbergia sp. UHCC 0137]
MLARLQSAIGRDDLVEKMVLLPEPKRLFSQKYQEQSVKIVVGYDDTPESHTALDIAFWIAYQTRLATNTQVKVHVVYVVEEKPINQYSDKFTFVHQQPQLECPVSDLSKSVTLVLTQPKLTTISPNYLTQTNRIFSQANILAEEWESSCKSHLQFGSICTELQKVVELESADILFLGCQSSNHPMIKKLGSNFPCAVLGIPSCMDD